MYPMPTMRAIDPPACTFNDRDDKSRGTGRESAARFLSSRFGLRWIHIEPRPAPPRIPDIVVRASDEPQRSPFTTATCSSPAARRRVIVAHPRIFVLVSYLLSRSLGKTSVVQLDRESSLDVYASSTHVERPNCHFTRGDTQVENDGREGLFIKMAIK